MGHFTFSSGRGIPKRKSTFLRLPISELLSGEPRTQKGTWWLLQRAREPQVTQVTAAGLSVGSLSTAS